MPIRFNAVSSVCDTLMGQVSVIQRFVDLMPYGPEASDKLLSKITLALLLPSKPVTTRRMSDASGSETVIRTPIGIEKTFSEWCFRWRRLTPGTRACIIDFVVNDLEPKVRGRRRIPHICSTKVAHAPQCWREIAEHTSAVR